MRNLWNIDLGSVRPAELHSAADHRTGSDNARRQRANCPLGAQAGCLCSRLPPIRMNAQLILRVIRSEEHTSELQSRLHLVCRLLLEKKKYRTRRSPRRLLIQDGL